MKRVYPAPMDNELQKAINVIIKHGKTLLNPVYKDIATESYMLSLGLADAFNHEAETLLLIAGNLAEDVNHHDLAKFIREQSAS